MIEIIFWGRGGQGAVTASQILATAAFNEGKYAQAVPFFGGERKGAPVTAHIRISDEAIEIRTPIEKADILIVLDPMLLKTTVSPDCLKSGGLAIINTNKSPEEIKKEWKAQNIEVNTIDATEISDKIYGQSSIPKVNTTVLGFAVTNTKMISPEYLLTTIGEYFPGGSDNKAIESAKLGLKTVAQKAKVK
ncbi:2-oxoacid:acceptor oxidoreductase family protein [Chloroflexota bacterium]